MIPRVRTEEKNWKHRGTENTEGRQTEGRQTEGRQAEGRQAEGRQAEGRQTEELCALCVSVFQNGCCPSAYARRHRSAALRAEEGTIYCEAEEEEGKIGDWAVLPMTVVQRRTRHERISPWRT